MIENNKDGSVTVLFYNDSVKEPVAEVSFTAKEFREIKARASKLGVTIEEYFEEVMRTYLEMYG